TLNVDGTTTLNGITNTGDLSTATLHTTGLATLNSASVTNNQTIGGTLGVTGATTTHGVTNTGDVSTGTLHTTGLATLNSASVTNNHTIGGNIGETRNWTPLATPGRTAASSGATIYRSVRGTLNSCLDTNIETIR